MNLRIFIHAIVFTSASLAFASDWKVDFSRRFHTDDKVEMVVPPRTPARAPASVRETQMPPAPFVKEVFLQNDPAPEVVILNTENGFIPSAITLQEGQAYRFHVVNVNEEKKNVSFVMSAFNQHHATYYGQIQTFMIQPDKTGIFRYSSPETAAMGKVIVAPKADGTAPVMANPDVRVPASE